MGLIRKYQDFSKAFDMKYEEFIQAFADELEKDPQLKHILKLREKDPKGWFDFISKAFDRWSDGFDLGSVISCELMKRNI